MQIIKINRRPFVTGKIGCCCGELVTFTLPLATAIQFVGTHLHCPDCQGLLDIQEDFDVVYTIEQLSPKGFDGIQPELN